MDLRNIEATLPPGFRFYPSDEELVCHYLFKKITNEGVLKGTMVEVDLHTCEPWQLPDVAKLGTNEWYFFSFRDRKYATGLRTNRATKSGYWKATGKDRPVFDSITHAIVGMRKTLVFYQNRAPNGIKTGWVMHEFRLENPQMPPKEDWVLCRVFHKSKEERLEQEMRSIAGVSSPSLISCPPIDQRIQNVFPSFSQVPHRQDHIPSTLPNIALLNPSHQDYTQEFSSKVDDEYGFLFDMSSLEDGGPPNLDDEMRFHEESSTVFF